MPAMRDVDLPIRILREAFEADLASGRLIWRERPLSHFLARREWILTNGKLRGKPVGTLRKRGDTQVRLRWRGELCRSFVHRIVFALAHDRWPAAGIDHINGVEAGDGIANLREADQAGNNQNKRGWSGRLLGTTRHGRGWKASIVVDRKNLYLGTFNTQEEAHQAYLQAKKIHHTFNPEPAKR